MVSKVLFGIMFHDSLFDNQFILFWTKNSKRLYFDKLLFDFWLEILLRYFLDRWGQMKWDLAHCGDKGLFDEVHSDFKTKKYLWVPEM